MRRDRKDNTSVYQNVLKWRINEKDYGMSRDKNVKEEQDDGTNQTTNSR